MKLIWSIFVLLLFGNFVLCEDEVPPPTDQAAEVTIEQPSEISPPEQTAEVSPVEQSPEAPITEESSEAPSVENSSQSVPETSSEAPIEEQSSEASIPEQSSENPTPEESSEAPAVEQSSETPPQEPSPEVPQPQETPTEETPQIISTIPHDKPTVATEDTLPDVPTEETVDIIPEKVPKPVSAKVVDEEPLVHPKWPQLSILKMPIEGPNDDILTPTELGMDFEEPVLDDSEFEIDDPEDSQQISMENNMDDIVNYSTIDEKDYQPFEDVQENELNNFEEDGEYQLPEEFIPDLEKLPIFHMNLRPRKPVRYQF